MHEIPTREEQIAGRCKHFTGTQTKKCAVGVCYDDVTGKDANRGLPCLRHHGGDVLPCDKRELPTPDEVAAKIRRQDQGFLDTQKARGAITDKIGSYKRGHSLDIRGSIPCPVCQTGVLHYSRAAFNGHIHAQCSTEGCVAWME